MQLLRFNHCRRRGIMFSTQKAAINSRVVKMKCESCQLESDRPDIFKVVPRSFQSTGRTLCPACFAKNDHRTNFILMWIFFISGILSLPLIPNDSTRGFGIALLNISIFQVLGLISTIFHELGHAVAGRLVGFRVFVIEIGTGRVACEFLLGGLRWRIRSIVFGGLTYAFPCNANFYRLKAFALVLGGPVTNAILLFISIKFLSLDQFFESTAFKGFVPMVLLALCNLTLLIFSLWPYTTNSAAGKIPNDGLLLLKMAQITNTQIEGILSYRYHYEADECRLQKDLTGARKWIDEGLRNFPDNLWLKMSSAGIAVLQRKYSESIRAYALMVGRHKKHQNLDSLLLNNIAYNYLLMGKPELLPKADKCSDMALKQSPWIVYYKGTRGSVLIELGKYDEGLKLLHDAMRNHPEKYGQALNACYIGIAEARRGNPVESRNYFSIARKLDPDCVLLEREAVLN
jgi:tetratricopeptide (TPR) repeat protein